MRFILLLCFVGLALARPQEDDVAVTTEAADPTTTEAAVAEAAVKDAESDEDSTTTTAPERMNSESGSEQINLADTSAFNDLLDVVESGLETDAEGRALFVTISMISTSTIPAKTTVTKTITNSCVAGTFVDCASTTTTTTTTVAPGGRKKRSPNNRRSIRQLLEKETVEMEQTEVLPPYQEFTDAIVTREDGLPATLLDILPTKASAAAPAFDPEAFNVDAVLDQNESVVSSGKVEWRDVHARGLTPCGRSDGRRPRILEIKTGNTTITSYATVLTTLIVPTTVTFSVQLTCTTAGFTFAVPACSKVVG